jgi:hypothetical protein
MRLARVTNMRVDAEEAALRADAAGREQERRDRARRWDESCAKHAAAFQQSYAAFGQQPPMRVGDESPFKFRRRLFRGIQDRLPDGHRLVGVEADQLGSDAIEEFERLLFEAAEKEGVEPSGSNLPPTVDDPRAMRMRQDSTNGRTFVEWKAKESFIKALGRPGRRVVAIHGKDGEAIWPVKLREAGFVRPGLVSR